MTQHRSLVRAQVTQLPDDQVEVVMATDQVARDGHVLDMRGVQLGNYRANPVILWNHDPAEPIGRAEDVSIVGGELRARIRFASAGISETADRIRGLVKDGVINSVSIGWDTIDAEPLDPKKPRGGMRIGKWELWECSFVSIPADTGAVVSARDATSNYEEKAGMNGERSVRIKVRGLWEVAQLAAAVDGLGWLKERADWEASIEGDGSQVPAMLGEVLKSAGEALIAMTQEEVAELIENAHASGSTEDEMDGERSAFVRALHKVRIGKKISAATAGALSDAVDHHDTALSALKDHDKASETMSTSHDKIGDALAKARTAHAKLGEAIQSGDADAISKRHASLGKAIDGAVDQHAAMGDPMDGAANAASSCRSAVRMARRCVRSVMASETEDGDTKAIQTSDGVDDSDGSANDRAVRLRTLEVLRRRV